PQDRETGDNEKHFHTGYNRSILCMQRKNERSEGIDKKVSHNVTDKMQQKHIPDNLRRRNGFCCKEFLRMGTTKNAATISVFNPAREMLISIALKTTNNSIRSVHNGAAIGAL